MKMILFSQIPDDTLATTSCIYISKYPIWAYQNGDTSNTNHAQAACQDIGLDLAQLQTEAENKALQEFTSNSCNCF